jgi:peroxiredoxin Q/BCP
MLKIGIYAPEIEAKDQDGQVRRLSDYRGSWVLLYFYPRDNTPGCTKEACTLRDNYAQFKKIKAVVLGVSKDSIASHEKFAQEFNLPFTLLADTDHQIVKAYGADGLFSRISYLIDPSGQIVKTYDSVKPAEHATEVLRDLASLQN